MAVQNSPTEQASDVLDWQALGNRCMGRDDLVQRILGKFQDGLASEIQQLEEACIDRNTEAIAMIAHRIKGTSLTVSANRLASAAEQLREVALGNGSLVEQEFATMRAEVERLTEQIERRLSGES